MAWTMGKPPIQVFFEASLSFAGKLSPPRLQRKLRNAITAVLERLLGVHWPPWLGGYINTCPALDAVAFFAAWLTLAVASATGQEWLRPLVWPTAGLFVAIFLGHWARDYLRDQRGSQDHANSAFIFALLISAMLALRIGYVVLHHVNPRSTLLAGATSTRSSTPRYPKTGSKAPKHSPIATQPRLSATPAGNLRPNLTPGPMTLPTTPPTSMTRSSTGLNGSLTYKLFHATPLPTTPPSPRLITPPPEPPAKNVDVLITPTASTMDISVPSSIELKFWNRADTPIYHLRYWAFIGLSSDSRVLNFPGNPSEGSNEFPMIGPHDWGGIYVTTFLQAERGIRAPFALPSGVVINNVYMFYVYKNSRGQTIPDERLFEPSGPNSYTAVRVALTPSLDKMRSIGRAISGYNGNDLLP